MPNRKLLPRVFLQILSLSLSLWSEARGQQASTSTANRFTVEKSRNTHKTDHYLADPSMSTPRWLPDGGYELAFEEEIKEVVGWHMAESIGRAPLPKVIIGSKKIIFVNQHGGRIKEVLLSPKRRSHVTSGRKHTYVVESPQIEKGNHLPQESVVLYGLGGEEIARFELPKGLAVPHGSIFSDLSDVPGRLVAQNAEDTDGDPNIPTGLYFLDKETVLQSYPDISAFGVWSPDGKFFAALIQARGERKSKHLNVYNTDGKLVWGHRFPEALTGKPCFSPDGTRLWVGSVEGVGKGKGWLIDIDGKVLTEYPFAGPPLFSDDGKAIVTTFFNASKGGLFLNVINVENLSYYSIGLDPLCRGNFPYYQFKALAVDDGHRVVLGKLARGESSGRILERYDIAINIDRASLQKVGSVAEADRRFGWTVELNGNVLRRKKPAFR